MKLKKSTVQAIWMIAIIIVLALLAGTVEQDNGQWPAAPEPDYYDYRIQ